MSNNFAQSCFPSVKHERKNAMPTFKRFHRLSKREADVERDKWAEEVLSLLAEQEHRSNDVRRLAHQWGVIIEAERKVEEERERQEAKEERERQKAKEERERNEKFWVAVLKAAFVSLAYAAILAILLGISSVEVFLPVVIGCGLSHFFLVQPLWEYVKTRSSKKGGGTKINVRNRTSG